MAFEGVPSKTKVDQYPLNPIGKPVRAWHRPSGPLRVFPACLWCRARAVGQYYSCTVRKQSCLCKETLRILCPDGRKLRTGVAAAFGMAAYISTLLVALLRTTVPAASEPPPKARHTCSLHVHGPAYGVASTGVQRDVPHVVGHVHRGDGGTSCGVCGGHGVRDGACEGTAYVMGCELPVRALAAGHYVPRALSAACAAAGVSGGQALATGRCVRGVLRARYRRHGRVRGVRGHARRWVRAAWQVGACSMKLHPWQGRACVVQYHVNGICGVYGRVWLAWAGVAGAHVRTLRACAVCEAAGGCVHYVCVAGVSGVAGARSRMLHVWQDRVGVCGCAACEAGGRSHRGHASQGAVWAGQACSLLCTAQREVHGALSKMTKGFRGSSKHFNAILNNDFTFCFLPLTSRCFSPGKT
ncbi:hypothetical protein GGX14DRAFT_671583 [Mycena pura]|uniref:Uncharacterized protein n=1 Tax=Mycena pura TaxID=153505 RepID=A0AAD6V111_9AGAR|nr:hypothetical protein GGX14DRAFT_671583 [Mycena pura]